MIDRRESAEPATVLLVEPSVETAQVVRDGLTEAQSSTNVRHVSDGDDALAFLERRDAYTDAPRPCLVVLRDERRESGPDGVAVLQAMGERTELERIPVVVLTTSPSDEAVREAYHEGANAVVPISTEPDALRETTELLSQFWIATARLPNRIDRL